MGITHLLGWYWKLFGWWEVGNERRIWGPPYIGHLQTYLSLKHINTDKLVNQFRLRSELVCVLRSIVDCVEGVCKALGNTNQIQRAMILCEMWHKLATGNGTTGRARVGRHFQPSSFSSCLASQLSCKCSVIAIATSSEKSKTTLIVGPRSV